MTSLDRPHRGLAFSYPHEHREPAAGFAARLAAVNGRTLSDFLRDMSIHPRDLDRSDAETIRAIAKLGNVDFEKLTRYTPRPLESEMATIAGETLGRRVVNRTFFSFCPCCVLDDLGRYDGPRRSRPWLRVQWTVSHFRSCPDHELALASAQPIRRPFAPFDFTETMEAILPDLERLSRDAQAAPSSPFQDWVLKRLDGERDPGNWLDRLPLYVGAGFCEALGISAGHHPKVKVAGLSQGDWATAADTGFGIAREGEHRIRELLRVLCDAQADTRGYWGARDTFGYAYEVLRRTADDPAFQVIRSIVSGFALENMPLEPGTNVLGMVVEERRVHTVRTAARDSGAHALTIRRMFERKGLAGDRDATGLMDHRVLVESDEIQRVIEALKTAVTGPEAERILSVPRLHLKSLVDEGHLAVIGDTASRAYAKRRFAPEELEAFRERWLTGAVEITKPSPRQLDVLGTRRAATCEVPELLRLVLDGKLKWKGKLAGRNDYMSLLLDADEVTAAIRSTAKPMGGLSKSDAEAFIPGTTGESIVALIELGHLQLVEEYNPIARRMVPVISRDSAETFLQSHVTLGELCRMAGRHHKSIRKTLREARIIECLDPEDAKMFVYRRSEAIPAIRGSLH